MAPHDFEILASLMGFLGAGTFLLIGLRMFLTHRARRLTGGEGTRELAEQMTGLVDEVRALRDGVVELHERLDFAERLLAQQRESSDHVDRRLGR
jgi:hypothetical protein